MHDSAPRTVAPGPGPRIPAADAVVIQLRGDIDLVSVPTVSALLSHAATGATDELILDLSQVTFMDCAGLRPVFAARERLADRLWIQRPAPRVRLLLDLAGLLAAFAVAEEPVQEPAVATRGEGLPARDRMAALTAEQLVAALQEELRRHVVVGRATGLLMAAHRCSASRALERLVQAAQDHDVRVSDLCDELTSSATSRTGRSPGADVHAAVLAATRGSAADG